MNGLGGIQFYVAINSGALVPPAFGARAVDVNGNRIYCGIPEKRAVGKVQRDFRIRAYRFCNKRTVKIKVGENRNSFKTQSYRFAFKLFGKRETLAVPGVLADAVPVRQQFVFRKIGCREVVVRNANSLPVFVVVIFSGRSCRSARFAKRIRRRM